MQKLFVILCAIALGGCMVGRTQVDNLSSVGPNDVLVVGRIELVPPLDPNEQALNSVNAQLRGKAHAIIADKWFDLDDPGFSTYSSAAIIDLGKDFYVSQPRTTTLLYSGTLITLRAITRATGRRSAELDKEEIKLPGGVKYSVTPTDRAIYLGTIRYHRDVYNEITVWTHR